MQRIKMAHRAEVPVAITPLPDKRDSARENLRLSRRQLPSEQAFRRFQHALQAVKQFGEGR